MDSSSDLTVVSHITSLGEQLCQKLKVWGSVQFSNNVCVSCSLIINVMTSAVRIFEILNRIE